MISLPDWGLAPISLLTGRGKGVYRFAARQHVRGVEFASVGLDAGGSYPAYPLVCSLVRAEIPRARSDADDRLQKPLGFERLQHRQRGDSC